MRISVAGKAALFYAEIAAWLAAVILAIRGGFGWAAPCAALALLADILGRIWSRRSPVAMPHFMWWVLLLPRGPGSPRRLMRVLEPRSGERMLEIGPGIGVHALETAALLRPGGRLDVIDIQQSMLDDLTRRAERKRLTNIVAQQGDAQRLPYSDGTFDAAYLVSVLGEIPDRKAAFEEIRRVIKPAGRLVVNEVLLDPDFITLRGLEEEARAAGFILERSAGPRFAYTASFRPAP